MLCSKRNKKLLKAINFQFIYIYIYLRNFQEIKPKIKLNKLKPKEYFLTS